MNQEGGAKVIMKQHKKEKLSHLLMRYLLIIVGAGLAEIEYFCSLIRYTPVLIFELAACTNSSKAGDMPSVLGAFPVQQSCLTA